MTTERIFAHIRPVWLRTLVRTLFYIALVVGIIAAWSAPPWDLTYSAR